LIYAFTLEVTGMHRPLPVAEAIAPDARRRER
jgi:hypothetical protein